jgi:tetratricopeptide (TPR) repeat protein
LARIYSYLCQYFSVVRDPDQAVSFGERAHSLAEQVGDLAVRVPASFLLGEALYSLGQFHRGADVLQQILSSLQGDRQYERYGMTGLPASMSQYILAQCLAELGSFAEARSAANEAIRIAETASQPFSLAAALSINGFVYLLKGDVLQAIQTLERSVELCRIWNFSIHLTNASARLGYAHLLSGDVKLGLSMLEQAAKQAESVGRLYEQASIIGWLGLANLRAGRCDEALDLARRAFEVADQSRQHGKRAHTLRIRRCACGGRHVAPRTG